MRGCVFPIVMLLWVALPAGAQQSKQQKIQRIIEITSPDSVVTEVVNQVDGMMKQIRPNPTPQQKARQQTALDKIAKISKERMLKIRPELVKAYAETFTDEEIDGMLTFYETPAGRASITKIPAINSRMAGLIQSEMNALGPEINKIAEDALKP
jgi:uncharacterized protein